MKEKDDELRIASTGTAEELEGLVHTPDPRLLAACVLNRNFTEKLAVIIAHRKDISADILDTLAHDRRWKEHYPLKLALCLNPKTAIETSLALLNELRIFDRAALSKNHFVPVALKKRAEASLIEKIPTLPLGIKKNLARLVADTPLLLLLREKDREVLHHCLNNPAMTEGHLSRALNAAHVTLELAQALLAHPKWSHRHTLRYALVRNSKTPLAGMTKLLADFKTSDLKALHRDPKVPGSMKSFIHSELFSRKAL